MTNKHETGECLTCSGGAQRSAEATPDFKDGDEVIVTGGAHKGFTGIARLDELQGWWVIREGTRHPVWSGWLAKHRPDKATVVSAADFDRDPRAVYDASQKGPVTVLDSNGNPSMTVVAPSVEEADEHAMSVARSFALGRIGGPNVRGDIVVLAKLLADFYRAGWEDALLARKESPANE